MKYSLCLRILAAICRKLWAVLLFLSLFAASHVLNFAWPTIARSATSLAGLIQQFLAP
ncbi:hypothetical protein [Thermodesulfomicrobium sp. WS]|uniref:hypothetical protein n=1 Tax=Thermodesulfomicrobium sp. WS TaxID=3004129 RepID=UPI00249100BD|nr:hypothetical protein [Thermodesulfomicrobium sp. WS]